MHAAGSGLDNSLLAALGPGSVAASLPCVRTCFLRSALALGPPFTSKHALPMMPGPSTRSSGSSLTIPSLAGSDSGSGDGQEEGDEALLGLHLLFDAIAALQTATPPASGVTGAGDKQPGDAETTLAAIQTLQAVEQLRTALALANRLVLTRSSLAEALRAAQGVNEAHARLVAAQSASLDLPRGDGDDSVMQSQGRRDPSAEVCEASALLARASAAVAVTPVFQLLDGLTLAAEALSTLVASLQHARVKLAAGLHCSVDGVVTDSGSASHPPVSQQLALLDRAFGTVISCVRCILSGMKAVRDCHPNQGLAFLLGHVVCGGAGAGAGSIQAAAATAPSASSDASGTAAAGGAGTAPERAASKHNGDLDASIASAHGVSTRAGGGLQYDRSPRSKGGPGASTAASKRGRSGITSSLIGGGDDTTISSHARAAGGAGGGGAEAKAPAVAGVVRPRSAAHLDAGDGDSTAGSEPAAKRRLVMGADGDEASGAANSASDADTGHASMSVKARSSGSSSQLASTMTFIPPTRCPRLLLAHTFLLVGDLCALQEEPGLGPLSRLDPDRTGMSARVAITAYSALRVCERFDLPSSLARTIRANPSPTVSMHACLTAAASIFRLLSALQHNGAITQAAHAVSDRHDSTSTVTEKTLELFHAAAIRGVWDGCQCLSS